MIRILAFLWIFPCTAAFGQGRTCPQFFAGGQAPTLLNAKMAPRTTLLCNDFYAALASGITRGPLWSAEHLTRDSVVAARETAREGEFHAEDRLPEADRAELADYRRSGFDRGHMAPSGDMPDAGAQQQSFSLANMVPQVGEMNRGVWADVESAVRGLATRRGELFVVTGPAFTAGTVNTIGPNAVLVPTATWKAVFVPRQRSAGVYFCTNTDTPQCRTIAVSELVRLAGVDPFPALPAGVKDVSMVLPIPGTTGGRQHRGRGQRSDGQRSGG